MTDPPEATAPLSVETDLTLTVDGNHAEVRSTGDRIFVEFSSLPGAVRAARGTPPGSSDDAAALLRTADLTVEIRSRGRTVVAIGPDAPAGPLSRLVEADPAQVRVAGILAAVGQEVVAAGRAVRRVFR